MGLLFGNLSTAKGREQYTCRQLLGFHHDCLTSPLPPAPDVPIEIQAFVGWDVHIVEASVVYTTDGSNPALASQAVSVVPMECVQTSFYSLSWSYCQCWKAVIPGVPENTLVQYVIRGKLSDGRLVYCPFLEGKTAGTGAAAGVFCGAAVNAPVIYGYYSDSFSRAFWLEKAVIYQIIPDRFFPGEGKKFEEIEDLAAIHGGTLNGITEKLDYLEALGVNCLWLTPVFPSPSHHGYDATTYDEIEPRLGSLSDFACLAQECRRRGIKLLLDFSANHVSSAHPFFQEALQDKNSKYVSWFRFKRWPDKYDCYYGLPFMPIFNSDNAEVRRYLIDRAMFWLDQGAAGYRLDHAHGLSQLFWSHFGHALKLRHPDAVMIGEVTEAPDRVLSYAGRLDGCLDFKCAELLRDYFGSKAISTSTFVNQIERHLQFASPVMRNPIFLDNHDMNRFLWLVKGDRRKLKLAALYQFLLPAAPVIYYGTEVGLSQKAPVGRLEQARLPMLWGGGQDRDLLDFYRELIAWRKRQAASINEQSRLILRADDARAVMILQTGKVIFVSNNSRIKQTVADILPGSELELQLRTDSRITLKNGALELPPYSGAILGVVSA